MFYASFTFLMAGRTRPEISCHRNRAVRPNRGGCELPKRFAGRDDFIVSCNLFGSWWDFPLEPTSGTASAWTGDYGTKNWRGPASGARSTRIEITAGAPNRGGKATLDRNAANSRRAV